MLQPTSPDLRPGTVPSYRAYRETLHLEDDPNNIQKSPSAIWPAWAVLLSSLLAASVNLFVDFQAVVGSNMKAVSARWHTFLTPAGPAFAIWLIIYLGTLIVSVWQLAPNRARQGNLSMLRGFLIGAAFFNLVFPFAFTASYIPGAWLAVVGLGLCCWGAYRQAYRYRASNLASALALKMPVSLYLGWSCVAAGVSTTQLLAWAGMGLTGGGAEEWAMLLGGLLVLLASYLAWRHADSLAPLAIAWAFYWISLEQFKASVSFSNIALIAAIITAIQGLAQFFRPNRGAATA